MYEAWEEDTKIVNEIDNNIVKENLQISLSLDHESWRQLIVLLLLFTSRIAWWRGKWIFHSINHPKMLELSLWISHRIWEFHLCNARKFQIFFSHSSRLHSQIFSLHLTMRCSDCDGMVVDGWKCQKISRNVMKLEIISWLHKFTFFPSLKSILI